MRLEKIALDYFGSYERFLSECLGSDHYDLGMLCAIFMQIGRAFYYIGRV